jgi:excisionase family DNA binding protein
VAQILGVSENDVMQSISGGELKAKTIGSSYRITRHALDEFLKS